jgi:hypothetical protein
MEESKVMEYFLGLLGQVKVFHWSTMKYGQHKALDDLHSSLSSSVDKFVEVFLGKYKKQPVKVFKITMDAVSDMTKLDKFLETERENIRKMYSSFSKVSELQNIMDEMMGAFDQAIYLCNLQ